MQVIPVQPHSHNTPWLLRVPFRDHPDRQPEMKSDEQLEDKDSEKGKYLLCRQCRTVITSPAERIEMSGSHQHTFANPYGIIYQLGCFRSAPGCRYVGHETKDWSWFPGYQWRIAICCTCRTHLGWLFLLPGKECFHGLVMDYLMQLE